MSDQDRKPFYITTAIAYTSSKPHIGNTYDPVLADAIARYKRQRGFDVYFQTGSDEHGQKIQLAAEKEGISPKGVRGPGVRPDQSGLGQPGHRLRPFHPHHRRRP